MKCAKIAFMVCLFVFCLFIPVFSAQGSDRSSVPIFQEVPLEMDRAESANAKTATIRERFVSVDFAVLTEPDILPGVESQKELVLNLFDDTSVMAIIDQVTHNASGSSSWTGHLKDLELSEVVMVLKDQMMVGNISYEGRFYQIRYVDGELHTVHEIDQSQFPAEMDPVPLNIPESDEISLQAELLADDVVMEGDDSGAIIDIMVVYTDDARAAEGGTAAMEALIELAVAETNIGYANSHINHRLNLVHTAEVAYDETNFDWSSTLSRLQSRSDGYMDVVHSLRDSYGADEVALIIEGDGVYCGLGYLMTSVSSSFADYAFYEVSRECAAGTYSFGHELGHNMGARHDWYVDEETSPYSYSHGYVNRTDLWRTVMAYNSECDDQGVYCSRINYWSNPTVSYSGAPTGVAGGTSTACAEGDPNHPACDADNVRTLNNTASTTAAFRSNGTSRYVLDVSKTGDGTGGVSSDDGRIDCGGDCSEIYDANATVTLTATPGSFSRFDGWSGGGCSGTGPCVVTLSAATTVTATFSPDCSCENYSEDFEGISEFGEILWSTEDGNSDGREWYIYNDASFAHSGDRFAIMFPNNATADDWLFSKCLEMEAGRTYRVTFYADRFTQNEELRLSLGTAPNALSMSTTLNQWTLTGGWQMIQEEITVPSDGVYYLGWYSYANPSYALRLDDVSVEDITPVPDSAFEYGSTGTIIDKNKTSIWHSIGFSENFGNAPVFVADMQTNWGGEPAELRMQNLTGSAVEIKLEEDKSVDNENNHLAENVGYLALTPGPIENAAGETIGETGSLEARTTENNDWESLTFQRSYTNPVVRMQMVTFGGAAPSHVRLRNVSGSGLEFQIEEWDHDDQFHGWETVNYVVVEVGDHVLPNNTRLVADTVDISADGSGLFTKVLFFPVFADTPIVFSQSQSYNDPAALVTRQKDIRANRVKVRLVEEEAADQVHGSETVGYIAIGALAAGDELLGVELYPDELAPSVLDMGLDVFEKMSFDLLENPAVVEQKGAAESYSPRSSGKAAEQKIPEPSMLVLLVSGLFGLSGLWRKLRRK